MTIKFTRRLENHIYPCDTCSKT